MKRSHSQSSVHLSRKKDDSNASEDEGDEDSSSAPLTAPGGGKICSSSSSIGSSNPLSLKEKAALKAKNLGKWINDPRKGVFFWYHMCEQDTDRENRHKLVLFGKLRKTRRGYRGETIVTYTSHHVELIVPRTIYVVGKPGADLEQIGDEFHNIRRLHGITKYSRKEKERWVEEKNADGLQVAVLRPVFKVRYPFLDKELPARHASWTFVDFLHGCSDTMMENLIISRKLKGPGWLVLDENETGLHMVHTVSNPARFGLGLPPLLVATVWIKESTRDGPFVSIKCSEAKHCTLLPDEKDEANDEGAFHGNSSKNGEHGMLATRETARDDSRAVNSSKEESANVHKFKGPRSFIEAAAFLKSNDPDVLVYYGSHINRLKGYRAGRCKNHEANFGRISIDAYRAFCNLEKSLQTYSLASMRSVYSISAREPCAVLFSFLKRTEMLDQSLRITELCGNIWKDTLSDLRSSMAHFLILHELASRKCLTTPPSLELINEDRKKKKKNKEGEDDEDNDGNEENKIRGGKILESKIGLFENTYHIDFISLYPSLIIQFNICFTAISFQKTENRVSLLKMAGIGCNISEVKFLIQDPEIWYSSRSPQKSDRRKKEEISEALRSGLKHDDAHMSSLRNKERALKLLANCIYGCSGFKNFRFYSPQTANEITQRGREMILSIVEPYPNALYGHTDSAILRQDEYPAEEVMNAINARYAHIQIKLECRYSRLIILANQKYAGLDSNGKIVKCGIDRRNVCTWQARLFNRVITHSLHGKPLSDIESLVEEELSKLEQVPLRDLAIASALRKNLDEYKEKQKAPHVVVAREMQKRGLCVERNQVIRYIHCVHAPVHWQEDDDDENEDENGVAEKATFEHGAVTLVNDAQELATGSENARTTGKSYESEWKKKNAISWKWYRESARRALDALLVALGLEPIADKLKNTRFRDLMRARTQYKEGSEKWVELTEKLKSIPLRDEKGNKLENETMAVLDTSRIIYPALPHNTFCKAQWRNPYHHYHSQQQQQQRS